MTEHEKKALSDFLMDEESFKKLSKWGNNSINIFEIAGIGNMEIKHSNVLSWLFNANENHCLGDLVVKKFLLRVVQENKNLINIPLDMLDISLLNFSNFIVKREWEHIDICLVSDKDKVVIAIENKLYANERYSQTIDYRKVIEKYYGDYKKVYIFLTREGKEAQDKESWATANYLWLVETIETILLEEKNLILETKFILNNYIVLLRRKVVMDKELKETCEKIYQKHKVALELLYQFRPNNKSGIYGIIKEFIIEHSEKYGIIFNETNCNDSYIRFSTKYMKEIFPDSNRKDLGWGTGSPFIYEIHFPSNSDTVKVKGVFSEEDLHGENNYKLFNIIKKHHKQWNMKGKKTDEPKRWERVFRSEIIVESGEWEEDVEDVSVSIVERLKKLFEETIPAYEQFIKEKW